MKDKEKEQEPNKELLESLVRNDPNMINIDPSEDTLEISVSDGVAVSDVVVSDFTHTTTSTIVASTSLGSSSLSLWRTRSCLTMRSIMITAITIPKPMYV